MSRGRAGVISKEYKGEENTEFHDIIKLFKIYRVVNWQMQIKINQVSVMLSLMYQANHRSSNYWLRKETNIFSDMWKIIIWCTLVYRHHRRCSIELRIVWNISGSHFTLLQESVTDWRKNGQRTICNSSRGAVSDNKKNHPLYRVKNE